MKEITVKSPRGVEAKMTIREGTIDELFEKEIWKDDYYMAYESREKYNPQSGDVVVDVGAHIGFFTVLAAKLGCRVWAYEPHKGNYELLEKNVRDNELLNVVLYNCAMTPDGKPVLFVEVPPHPMNENNTGKHFVEFENGVEPSESLTDLLQTIPQISLLKLDIEGGEYHLLYSLDAECFKKIDRIVMEFHGDSPEEATAGAWRMAHYLSELGYRCVVDYAWGNQGRLQAFKI
jgi:FkbM family methyltransferase